MSKPKAVYDKPVNTDKFRVMFTMAHSILVTDQDTAENVAELVNTAYARGRSDIQRELRSLLEVHKAED